MKQTIQDILGSFRQEAANNRDVGDKFERLVAAFLTKDELYADVYSDVWLWGEWPGRGNKTDTGVDLLPRSAQSACRRPIDFAIIRAMPKPDIVCFISGSPAASPSESAKSRPCLRELCDLLDVTHPDPHSGQPLRGTQGSAGPMINARGGQSQPYAPRTGPGLQPSRTRRRGANPGNVSGAWWRAQTGKTLFAPTTVAIRQTLNTAVPF
jgi:hypothetical protein